MRTLCRVFFFLLFAFESASALAGIPTIRYHVSTTSGSGPIEQDVASPEAACALWGNAHGWGNGTLKANWDVPRWGSYPSTPILCIYSTPFSPTDERTGGFAYCGPAWNVGNSFTVDKTLRACGCQPPSRYMPDADACVSLSAVTNPPPNNPKNNGSGCPHCGQPINPTNGNMWHRELDYAASANSLLKIHRTYNSSFLDWGANDPHLFGTHWTTWLDMRLRPEIANATLNFKCWKRADNSVVLCDGPPLPNTQPLPDAVSVLRADGKRFYFNRSGTDFIGDRDVNERLYATLDSTNQLITGWNLVTPDATVEAYAIDGRLLSITDRNGERISLTYSDGTTNDTSAGRWPTEAPACLNVPSGDTLPAGRVLCATDSAGRQLNFEYDPTGFISKLIDPNGRTILYEHDGTTSNGCAVDSTSFACHLGNLTRATYQDGKSRTYYYNEASGINKGASCSGAKAVAAGFGHLPYLMTGLVDENVDRYISWDYTCDGYADISQLAGGVEKLSIDYSNLRSGNTFTYVTHYSGTAEAPTTSTQDYEFAYVLGAAKNNYIGAPCYECGPYKQRWYDSFGNLTSALDWNGNYRCYAYDVGRNLETARIEGTTSSACSTLLSSTSLTLPTRKISTQWHPTLRLPVQVAEPKRITSYAYAANGNMLSRSVQATTDATGANGFTATTVGAPRTWTFTYNEKGKMATRKGPRSDIDDTTRFEYDPGGNLTAIVNALGQRTEYSGYDASGNVGQIRESNGKTTSYTYNERGWVTGVLVTAGPFQLQSTFEYDGVGQLVRVTNADSSYLAYTYDKAHRLIRVADSSGNSINYTLDLLGNSIREQTTDSNGALTRQISRVYDTFNNLKQVTGAEQ